MYIKTRGINFMEIKYDKAGSCHAYARSRPYFRQSNHKSVVLWRASVAIFPWLIPQPSGQQLL